MQERYKKLIVWLAGNMNQVSTKIGISMIAGLIGWQVSPENLNAIVTLIGFVLSVLLILHNENPQQTKGFNENEKIGSVPTKEKRD